MKFKIIRRDDSTSATLWFLGWGFDSSIEPFIPDRGNVILLWDYTSLSLDCDLSAWESFSVKAWSMGVWAAEAFLSSRKDLNITRAEAYCGTSLPADAAFGIGSDAIRLTIDHWSEVNRRKFARKICVDAALASLVEPLLTSRTADDQKAELESILGAQAGPGSFKWDLAVISLRDRIFPVAAQRAWWKGRAAEVEERDIPHWPFAHTLPAL